MRYLEQKILVHQDFYIPSFIADEKTELFQLEFEDKEGDILTLIVYQVCLLIC